MFHFYYHPWYFPFSQVCEQILYCNFLAHLRLLKNHSSKKVSFSFKISPKTTLIFGLWQKNTSVPLYHNTFQVLTSVALVKQLDSSNTAAFDESQDEVCC